MVHRVVALFGILLVLLGSWPPALAATAIAYSPAGQAYGWCAGYSTGRAPACAIQYCQKNGGTQCQGVLDCPDGWGAVAFAEDPAVAFAADCGLSNSAYARSHALAACVAAANGLCWTDSTFDANGNTRSKQSNLDFDLVWYAQSLLQLNGYTKSPSDGVLGPDTLAALAKFQQALGRPVTSTVDEETVRRLLDAEAGTTAFAKAIKRDIVDPKADDLSGYLFATAGTPNPPTSFSEELMARPEADRRLALATFLSSENSKCTLPATSATPLPDASSGVWDIDCAEGNFTLMLSEGGGSVIMSSGKPDSGAPAPAGKDQTPPAGGTDAPATPDGAAPASGPAAPAQPATSGRDLTPVHPH